MSQMSTEVLMPKVGMSTSEITLNEWLVASGDEVATDQVIATVESEKTEVEVEAVCDGFIDIRLDEGGEAKPGALIAVIGDSREAAAEHRDRAVSAEAAPPDAHRTPGTDAAPLATPPREPVTGGTDRVEATPIARKLAAENRIDLSLVTPTGPQRRVVRADVDRAIALVRSATETGSGRRPDAGGYEVAPEQVAGLTAARVHRLSGMTGAISAQMMASLHGMAQLTIGGRWNADRWVAHRDGLLARQDQLGCRVSYTAMMIFALSRALRRHPNMNASIVGSEVVEWAEVNIGAAVSAGVAHLSVPVIRNADQKGLVEIARELADLAARVRNGTITAPELTGSTFTLTSVTGSANSWGTPVINPPNAAILGTQPIVDAPVVRDGRVVAGKVLPASLTFDHRLVNGVGAEEFCLTVSHFVESPEELFG